MENIQLYKGDCLQVMQELIDKGVKVDMVLTDPPYGTTACKWDSVIPFESMWDSIEKIVRNNSYITIFGSQPFTTKLISSNIDNFSHQWIWNKKSFANPLLANKQPLKTFEDIIVFCFNYNRYDPNRSYFKKILEYIGLSKSEILKENNQGLDHCFRFNSLQFDIPSDINYSLLIDKYNIDKMNGFKTYKELSIIKSSRVYNPQMKKLDKQKTIGGDVKGKFLGDNVLKCNKKKTDVEFPRSILDFSINKRESLHPTQKPVALLEYLIKTYTNEGDTVLDFTMGSGSTGVACINTGRKFIGIELDDKYFDIAKKRINDAVDNKKQSLF